MEQINAIGRISEDQKSSLVKAIKQCFIDKKGDDKILHPLLTNAFTEINSFKEDERDYLLEVFLRNLFFLFYKRNVARSITRWLTKYMEDWLYYRDKNGYLYNLNLLVEYGNYSLLFYNEIRTLNVLGKTGKYCSRKNPSKIIFYEIMSIPLELCIELVRQNYKKDKGKYKGLIAQALPKFYTTTIRYTKLIVGKTFMKKTFSCIGKKRVRINGIIVPSKEDIVLVKDGDIIIFTRDMQEQTIARLNRDNLIVKMFMEAIGIENIKEYKLFRRTYNDLEKFSPSEISIVDQIKDLRDYYKDHIREITLHEIFSIHGLIELSPIKY